MKENIKELNKLTTSGTDLRMGYTYSASEKAKINDSVWLCKDYKVIINPYLNVSMQCWKWAGSSAWSRSLGSHFFQVKWGLIPFMKYLSGTRIGSREHTLCRNLILLIKTTYSTAWSHAHYSRMYLAKQSHAYLSVIAVYRFALSHAYLSVIAVCTFALSVCCLWCVMLKFVYGWVNMWPGLTKLAIVKLLEMTVLNIQCAGTHHAVAVATCTNFSHILHIFLTFKTTYSTSSEQQSFPPF